LILVLFTVAEVMTFTINFIAYLPLVGYYLQGGEVMFSSTNYIPSGFERYWTDICLVSTSINYPYNDPVAVAKTVNALSYVYRVLNLAVTFFSALMYISIFRNYAPRFMIWGTILSVFGFFAPCIFAIRNNQKIDYAEYVRRRYAAYYNNPYGYGNGGGYGGAGQGPAERSSDDPFSEFSGKDSGSTDRKEKDDEPFSEFSDDKKDDK